MTDSSAPFFSVVVPTYNRRVALQRALDSAFAQTFRHFEILVIDDGSKDDTIPYLQGINDSRLRILGDGTNGGAAAARNLGIREARGEWIAFLDSDDRWLPEKLQRFHQAILESPHIAFWYSGNSNINDRTGLLVRDWCDGFSGDHLPVLGRENPIRALPAVVVRRDLALQMGGFDERLTARQDMDFYFRVAHLTPFGFVPELLTVVHGGADFRISDSSRSRLNGWVTYYRKHRKALGVWDRIYTHKRIFMLAVAAREPAVAVRFMPGALLGLGTRPQ